MLWIAADADLDEIIALLAGSHSHGGPWADFAAPDYEFAASIEFIEGILEEEVVGCTLKSGGVVGRLDQLRHEGY